MQRSHLSHSIDLAVDSGELDSIDPSRKSGPCTDSNLVAWSQTSDNLSDLLVLIMVFPGHVMSVPVETSVDVRDDLSAWKRALTLVRSRGQDGNLKPCPALFVGVVERGSTPTLVTRGDSESQTAQGLGRKC